MTFEEHNRELAPIEEFSSDVFLPGPDVDSKECGFFLGLALAYNDLKDLLLCNVLLADLPKAPPGTRSPSVGQKAGLHSHLFRTLFSTLHELLKLIEGHADIVEGPRFRRIYAHSPKPAQRSWSKILNALGGVKLSTPFAKALYFVRNKVGFHYDVKELHGAFKAAFSRPEYGAPALSRGNNWRESRFYFADAASQEYMIKKAEAQSEKEAKSWSRLVNDVNHALYWLVLGFIRSRETNFRSNGS